MEMLTVVLIALVLIGVVAVAAGLYRQQSAIALQGQVATLDARLAAKSDEILRLEKDLGILREDQSGLRKEKDKAETDLATAAQALKHAKEDAEKQAEILTTQFRALSAEMLEKHGNTLKSQNKEQIEGLLKPLREKIVDFERGLTDRHTQASAQNAALKEQLSQLGKLNKTMVDEASNLTRALKGESQTQGAWGEMILETILQKTGLREGIEYDSQASSTDAEGRRLRPDIVVNLPDGERIIVDSKVSLTAFEKFVNAEDEKEKQQALAAHVTSLRAHIDELAKKDYTGAVGSRLDYVIMFVPIEGALAVALNADAELTGKAIERNVAIATPTTLMTMLKTVSAMWGIERQHQNAEEIAKRAGLLYDKFAGFVESLEGVGNRIKQAQAEYETAHSRLYSGTGNLIRQVETIKELGAKTRKALPAELVAKAGPVESVGTVTTELAEGTEKE
ncbi:MAG: DNA recombination protein RmuC [Myxococcales bacterium]|nr:DNA recombination protein RmuC [Myxococcales bacterium]MCH7867001.1 DNA recombination protein RmuC [Myxococcales bacterium]